MYGKLMSGATTLLPRSAVPLHYDITLKPGPAAATFTGTVAITLNVLHPTRGLTLNASHLNIRSAQLLAHGKSMAAKITADQSNKTATFEFDKTISSGRYTLQIDHDGQINLLTVGLFALDYDSVAGHWRALFTQLDSLLSNVNDYHYA